MNRLDKTELHSRLGRLEEEAMELSTYANWYECRTRRYDNKRHLHTAELLMDMVVSITAKAALEIAKVREK